MVCAEFNTLKLYNTKIIVYWDVTLRRLVADSVTYKCSNTKEKVL